jgi:hypothetical protein
MKSPSYTAGKIDATEQIVAFIYERYMYHRTFHGKDSELALSLKNLIHTIRDMQAEDLQEDENE